MVFTEAQKKLVKEGEKWLKDTTSSCKVAATSNAQLYLQQQSQCLVAPASKGNDHPILSKHRAFTVIGISDALSPFSSVAAILIFLFILTACYAGADFLYALLKRLLCGLFTLFLAITSMVVAFSSTIYMVFATRRVGYSFLVDIIHSTYKLLSTNILYHVSQYIIRYINFLYIIKNSYIQIFYHHQEQISHSPIPGKNKKINKLNRQER